MIPCPECGVLYGTKHTTDCLIKATNWGKLKDAIIQSKVSIMKTPKDHEWPDFLQNETPEVPPRERPKAPEASWNSEKAMRFNAGKPEMSYITDFPNAVEGLARIMEFGAQKYERDNWKKGLEINDYIDCFMRHVTDYKRGIKFDAETGLHQFFHMAVNAMMLAEIYGIQQEEKDKDIPTEELMHCSDCNAVWDARFPPQVCAKCTGDETYGCATIGGEGEIEDGRVMSDDASDAAAYAMMTATIVEDTSRGPVDDTTTAREDEPGATVAGAVSTAEDALQEEPTPLMFDRLTEADVVLVCKKAQKLAAAIGTSPMDVLNEYAMMFFDDPIKRNEFYAACRREIQSAKAFKTVGPFVKPDNEVDPLGR